MKNEETIAAKGTKRRRYNPFLHSLRFFVAKEFGKRLPSCPSAPGSDALSFRPFCLAFAMAICFIKQT
jgi:hypothetical protein